MELLTGFLNRVMYVAQQSSNVFKKKSLRVKNFFSLQLETEPMAYAEELDLHMYRSFHIIGYIFKIRIILCKLKLGSWGGNILNNTNLFLKKAR